MRWAVKSGVLALGLATGLGNFERAGAAYVEYTMTTSASGTLGGKAFTHASITITGIGDTAQIQNPSPGIFNLELIANSLFIAGFPTESFELADMQMGVNQTTREAGFVFGQAENLVLGFGDPGLFSYELGFPAGPYFGTPLFLPGQSFATTAGALEFSSFSDDVSFTAAAGPAPAVPEPSSMTLAGLGLATLAGSIMRRRRAA
jgi:hypothetical protein